MLYFHTSHSKILFRLKLSSVSAVLIAALCGGMLHAGEANAEQESSAAPLILLVSNAAPMSDEDVSDEDLSREQAADEATGEAGDATEASDDAGAPDTGPASGRAQALPEAENIDLKKVVVPSAAGRDTADEAALPPLIGPMAEPIVPAERKEPEPKEPEPEPEPEPESEPVPADPASPSADRTADIDMEAEEPQADSVAPEPISVPVAEFVGPPVPDNLGSITLLGSRVPPRTSTRLEWLPDVSFAGIAVPTPVLIVNGASPGPVLCLTAAIHGDELNGIEVVRRLIYQLDVDKLKGAVIGVPIVNLQGFQSGSRYLADRRDLNRHFPGNPRGSVASRIAHSFFEEVIDNCDALVDVHTGSFHRTNLPQVRADLNRPEVKAMSQKFGATVVLHTPGGAGTLRRAATDAGIPAVTIEAGEPMRLQEDEVNHGVKSLRSLLDQMGMYSRFSLWGNPEPVYYESVWIRSDAGGILLSNVKLGAHVGRNALLGTVVDPITNAKTEIRVPFAGRILGMAVNQVVMPGYATYHVGVRAEPANLPVEPAVVEPEPRTRAAEPVQQPPADELEDSEE